MCRSIRIAWGALRTHLQYAVDAEPENRDDDEVFHAQAIVEYSQQIAICARELKHINIERKKSLEKNPCATPTTV